MYSQSFFVVGNSFGEIAVFIAQCYICSEEGAPSSPTMFILTFDPFDKMIRACFMPVLSNPTGSSPFADDSNLHTDGPDAIPAMSILVTEVGAFVHWMGLFVNMVKFYIPAIDLPWTVSL